MVDDGGLLAGRCPYGPSLPTLDGVVGSLLEGTFGDSQTLNAHAQPGVVHHLEHVTHALMFLADKETGGPHARVAVGKHTGRAGVQAELVLDR